MHELNDEKLARAHAHRLKKLEKEEKEGRRNPTGYAHFWISLIALGTFILVMVAINSIVPDRGAIAFLRNFVMASLASILVYGVGYFAISHAAERVAYGSKSMFALCLSGFILSGGVLAPLGYFSMSKKVVEEQLIVSHGEKLKSKLSFENQAALDAQTLTPLLLHIKQDVTAVFHCERGRGCLTGRPYKGKGLAPVSDLLDRTAKRLTSAYEALEQGEEHRASLMRKLNKASVRFYQLASDRSINHAEKRGDLMKLDAEIRNDLALLERSSPIAVIQNLVLELKQAIGGQTSSLGQREGMMKAIQLINGHSSRLKRHLETLENDTLSLDNFPEPASLADAFTTKVLWNTFPYLLLAFLLECSGLFCFFLCINYHRGRIEDELALLGFESLEQNPNSYDGFRLPEQTNLNGRISYTKTVSEKESSYPQATNDNWGEDK